MPGTQVSCRCDSGEQGFAVCENSESGFGACQCETSTARDAASGGSAEPDASPPPFIDSGAGGAASMSGGASGCGAASSCGGTGALDATDPGPIAPDGSDCGAPEDGWCPEGCIRIPGSSPYDSNTQCFNYYLLIACVRSCVDDGGPRVGRLLPDGTCRLLRRSCGDWAGELPECGNTTNTTCGSSAFSSFALTLGADAGNPCAFDPVFMPSAPTVPVALRGILVADPSNGAETQLLERASLDDCADRDGYFVDWASGTPTFVLCPATCTAPDAGDRQFVGMI